MALTLSLKAGAGLYIAGELFRVEEVIHSTHFVLSRKAKQVTGTVTKVVTQRFTITDEQAEEVYPDVWMSAGVGHPSNVASAVIEAPKTIVVLREQLLKPQVV